MKKLVLSNRLGAEMEGSLLDVYRVLRTQNPSLYMFYFSGADGEIAGASPETLVKLEGEKRYTFPLAGTRRREKDREGDERLEAELLQVERYMSIHRFSHVMHSGSTVTGKICKDKDGLDAVEAVLPQERFPVHRKSVPVRLSTSWRITKGEFTAAPLGIFPSRAVWIPVLQSGWLFPKEERDAPFWGSICPVVTDLFSLQEACRRKG